MDLDTYLSEQKTAKKLTLSRLASQLGIGVSHLHDIKTGRRAATLEVALEIERLTDGIVTVRDQLATRQAAVSRMTASAQNLSIAAEAPRS